MFFCCRKDKPKEPTVVVANPINADLIAEAHVVESNPQHDGKEELESPVRSQDNADNNGKKKKKNSDSDSCCNDDDFCFWCCYYCMITPTPNQNTTTSSNDDFVCARCLYNTLDVLCFTPGKFCCYDAPVSICNTGVSCFSNVAEASCDVLSSSCSGCGNAVCCCNASCLEACCSALAGAM